MNSLQVKFAQFQKEVSASLIERDEEIRIVSCAVACGEHVCLVGPPGTAKSMLLDSLMRWIDSEDKFSYCLGKYTTPEEILGHIDILALKNENRYVRRMNGKLPTARFAFIDEYWNGSSAVHNTLLKAVNERKVFDGEKEIDIPLIMLMTGSNRWPSPEEKQEGGAAFDRFLFRRNVYPVRTAAGLDRLLTGIDHTPKLSGHITIEEIEEVHRQVYAMPVSDDANRVIKEILMALEKGVKQGETTIGGGIIPGDRRKKKSMIAARAAAWLDGASMVLPEHLEITMHTLWMDPGQINDTTSIVASMANPVGAQIQTVLNMADEVVAGLDQSNLGQLTLASKKLGDCLKMLQRIGGGARADKVAAHIKGEVNKIKAKVVEQM
jgi:MoxR-like ATPase